MITFNFLPSQEKNSLEKILRLLAWRKFGIAILVAITLSLLSIWAVVWLLRQHESTLAAQIESAKQEQGISKTTSLETQIKEFNLRVKTIGDVESNRPMLTNRIATIAKAIPTGVSLEQLSVNLNTQSLILQGVARDRESYLNLKDSLTATNLFTAVDLPITDLISRTSIRFTLRTDLSEEFSKPPTSNAP